MRSTRARDRPLSEPPTSLARAPIRRVVCAIDLRDGSDALAAAGAELARGLGASLDLVHACERAPDDAGELAARHALLLGTASRCADGVGEVRAHVGVGSSSDVILSLACTLGADLVLIGGARRGGDGALDAPSVVERLRRRGVRVMVVATPR